MRPASLALVVLAAVLLSACGAEDEPEPPTLALPAAISDTAPTTTGQATAAPSTAPPESATTATASSTTAAPGPPEALVEGGGDTVIAGLGSYCWSDPASGSGVCADSAAPRCDDGFTPRLVVPRGSQVQWVFQFEPAEGPTLTAHEADGQLSEAQPVLPVGITTQWQADLPPGEHAVSLFVRPQDGGDVSYTVCLDVTAVDGVTEPVEGSVEAAVEPGLDPDAAACVERWNAEGNAAVRDGVGFGLGATVEATPDGCRVTVIRVADEGGFAELPYAEGADGTFVSGETVPADPPGDGLLMFDPASRLVLPGTPEPSAPGPAVWSTPSSGEARAGPSAWFAAGGAAELDVIGCPDPENMPLLRVRAGETLTVALPFAPARPPVLTFLDGPRAFEEIPLVTTAAPTWAIDLPTGRHTAKLDVETPDGVEADYTACLDVTG